MDPLIAKTLTFLDAQECFNRAIEQGRLSLNEEEGHFVGGYMYMGTWAGVDTFKHRGSREYLPAPDSRTSSDHGVEH